MTYYGNVSTPSNRADWIETCKVIDTDTGDPIDLSTCIISMTVLKKVRNPNFYADGFYGRVYPNSIILTGSTVTGEITVVDLGTFQWNFPAGRMSGLPQGEYEVGVRFSQGGQIMQLIIGTINVREGIDWDLSVIPA